MDVSIGIMIFLFFVVTMVVIIAYSYGRCSCIDEMTLQHQKEMEKLRKIRVEEWLYPDREILDQPYEEGVELNNK